MIETGWLLMLMYSGLAMDYEMYKTHKECMEHSDNRIGEKAKMQIRTFDSMGNSSAEVPEVILVFCAEGKARK
jgi:hypothetical protein